MNTTVENRDGLLIVTPEGPRLTAANAGDFKQTAGDAADADAATLNMVVDMSHVEFIDSTGLGVLVSLLKKLAPAGQLGLVNVSSSRVKQLLALTRMDRVLKSYPDLDAAADALRGNG